MNKSNIKTTAKNTALVIAFALTLSVTATAFASVADEASADNTVNQAVQTSRLGTDQVFAEANTGGFITIEVRKVGVENANKDADTYMEMNRGKGGACASYFGDNGGNLVKVVLSKGYNSCVDTSNQDHLKLIHMIAVE